MFSSKVEKKDFGLEIHLEGEILDDRFQMAAGVGDDVQAVRIVCSKVTRISSVGVLNWMRNMEKLKNRGVAMTFVECSVVLVEQLNMIKNFLQSGKLESVYIPFVCLDCSKEFSILMNVKDLLRKRQEEEDLDHAPCPHCRAQNTAFDDLPSYFRFLDTVQSNPL